MSGNHFTRKLRYFAVAASTMALSAFALVAAGSGTAMASSLPGAGPGGGVGVVKAVTHSTHHPDTTNVETGVTSDNGPVWAYDNLSRQFVVSPLNEGGAHHWLVNVTDTGSFAGFADPVSGQPFASAGSVRGTYQVVVYDDAKPDLAPLAANLPDQVPGAWGTGQTIRVLFGDPNAQVEGGPYCYSYQNDAYVQAYDGTTSTITGGLRGGVQLP